MYVLGIESSCDETAASVIYAKENGYRNYNCNDHTVLSNVVYSQIDEHKAFGGVVPEIAARAHLEKIDHVVEKALKDAQLKISDLTAVAGTCGPGLIGGLIVGSTFAKSIAVSMKIPFIAVNHIDAHALSIRLTEDIQFPYLLLLASGGHCQLWAVHDIDKFETLGKTIDDSVGESFDKVSKMLGFGYPGGPIIEKLSEQGDQTKFHLPSPMCTKDQPTLSCDFSFSGLKTAVRAAAEKCFSEQDKIDLCASFQQTVTNILSYKMNRAIDICKEKNIKISAAVIAGGVAANKSIKKALTRLCDKNNLPFCAPPMTYCTDNGAMIAWMGVEKLRKNKTDALNIPPFPR